MKKLERRAILFLLLAFLLVFGLGVYMYRYVTKAETWAAQPYNSHLYTNGQLISGSINDVNGNLLVSGKNGKVTYAETEKSRRATSHAVGDTAGNVSTGAVTAFRSKMTGYNLITGAYTLTGSGKDITLTIDKNINLTAYEALGVHKGLVGVYNYKTGEIICMVSKPTFDPKNMTKNVESGTYLNKFLSGTITPGSIFKLVTSAAAIENYDKLDDWSVVCNGSKYYGNQRITCTRAHGRENFSQALANSCNVGFADLSEKVGAETMQDYVKKTGLTTSYDMDGVYNVKGTFEFPKSQPMSLAWAGIGQWKDQLNPCSMLVYMGAIANGGTGTVPKLIHDGKSPKETKEMINSSTAERLQEMMKNNVTVTYGQRNFPGLDIYAKSGTAEMGNGKAPNAWFAGFIKNENYPYAFIVCVENGGTGSVVAGPVANTVLQSILLTDTAATEE